MSMRKISVTVEQELFAQVQRQAGPRGISAFVNRAIRHELDRGELGELLAELEERLGPPDPVYMAEFGEALDRAEKARKRSRALAD